jgi:hypothetical protein
VFIKKNRGEWGEIYALAKILADGHLRIRSHVSATSFKQVPIIQIQRSGGNAVERYLIEGSHVRIAHGRKSFVSRAALKQKLKQFRDSIVKGGVAKEGAFELAVGEQIMQDLRFKNSKNRGKQKSDLHIEVDDPFVGPTGLEGYTVKSFFGAPPTLLNASGATRIVYAIQATLSDEYVYQLNTEKKSTLERFRELAQGGICLRFERMSPTFEKNLIMIDSRMPEVVAELVKIYYSRRDRSGAEVASLVSVLGTRNPLKVPNPERWYRYKMQELLEASSYGMIPDTLWDGRRTAAGGLIVVEKSGDVWCTPHRTRDQNREFLYSKTTLVPPDDSSGRVTGSGSSCKIDATLQIRYKSL